MDVELLSSFFPIGLEEVQMAGLRNMRLHGVKLTWEHIVWDVGFVLVSYIVKVGDLIRERLSIYLVDCKK